MSEVLTADGLWLGLWDCLWLKEAVSPLTPMPLIIVRDTKSWLPCSIGTTLVEHSSSRAPDWLRPLLQLQHSSVSPSAQSCGPQCSQVPFQRALLNKPPAWASQGLTAVFVGKPTCNIMGSARKKTLRVYGTGLPTGQLAMSPWSVVVMLLLKLSPEVNWEGILEKENTLIRTISQMLKKFGRNNY